MGIIAICAVITLVGAVVTSWLLLAGLAATLFSLYFFRDPDRKIAAAPGHIVAPADGKVLSIDEIEEHEFIGGRCKRISIFLSIFDVHINRAPASGTIETVRYRPGKFAFANTPDASLDNENNLIGIKGDGLRLAVKQIAGAVARRIICYCKPGQSVLTGERIGMIRFGSRTELYVPLECEILVSAGQKVKGGITLVGAYNGTVKEKT